MVNPNTPEFFKTTITKSDDKYVVADLASEASLTFTDIMDAKAAALLIESGIPLEALDSETILQFKIQLVHKRNNPTRN